MKRNDAFAQCMQRLDLARHADYRAAAYDDGWARRVVVYRAGAY